MTHTPSAPAPSGANRWTRTDVMIVAGGLVAAAALAALAHFGAMPRVQSFVGLIVILLIAFILSTNRRAINLRTIVWGLGLQIAFALVVLKTPVGQDVFQRLDQAITNVLNYSFVGSSFVFGPLGDREACRGASRRPMTGIRRDSVSGTMIELVMEKEPLLTDIPS